VSIRGFGDAFAVQRLLWLLVGTVVVPTILLAAYGVAAVRSQEVALLAELERQQDASLASAAGLLFDQATQVDQAARTLAAGCAPAAICATAPGIAAVWTWTGDPPAAVQLDVPAGPVTAFYPHDGGPIGIFQLGDRTAAYRIDLDAVRRDLAARIGEGDDTRRAIEWRNRWAYAVGLGALVVLVLVGAFVTLGSASREIRLSRLQTDFVSSVSHELRTPLTSIQMFVETLQSGRLRDPARIRECLDLIGQETERLSRRIERVLGWARMEAGRRIYEFEPVPARAIVEEAIQAVRSQTLLDEPEIAVEIPEDLPDVHGDRDALVEAVVNLLQNAVRYTPAPRRIAVRAAARGHKVALSVEDNGPGIAARHRKRIFEKFYQADNLLASPSTGRGTGLGLAIVRAVVRAHGGTIDLDTEVGAGSRFTIWLPIRAVTG
jgi:signal transduction histidine kinase